MQNADIVLDDVPGTRSQPAAERELLPRHRRDSAPDPREVAWQSVGVSFAAYEIALQYAKERVQFGQPIGQFQLVQDLLVKMLGNITASTGMMRPPGPVARRRASTATSSRRWRRSSARCGCARPCTGPARLLGGNGIVLDYNIGRYVADSEALYSYEGTREMQTLIVGRAITGGLSAFV